jgi:ketosteroid isomerase-like protein
MARAKDEVEARNRAAVNAGFDAWKNGTGSPYDLLADDVTWTIVGNSVVSGTYTSRQEFLSKVIAPINAKLSSRLVPTIRDVYSDGATVVVYFTAEGTAHGGQPYRNSYAWFSELSQEKIVKATAFFDSIAFNDFWHGVTPKS